jgi:hypothetical protein
MNLEIVPFCVGLKGLRIVDVSRRSHNFAPFVRQTGEKKAQACDMAIFHQQLHSFRIPDQAGTIAWMVEARNHYGTRGSQC